MKSEILRRSDYRPFDENMVLWDLLNKPIIFNDASKYKVCCLTLQGGLLQGIGSAQFFVPNNMQKEFFEKSTTVNTF